MSVFLQTLIFGLLCLVATSIHADDRVQSQITAAAENAVDKLAADVLDEQIGVDLTVADFVHATGSADKLMDLLRQSEQIGGPRWLDDQTCQVKLAIDGPRVLELLRQTAELNGNKTPIPAQALVKRLKDWKSRTFVATGTAISLHAAQELRPPVMTAWDSIPDAARKQAVLAAANNAAAKAIEDLKRFEYQPGESFAGAFGNQAVEQKLLAFLADRPVTGVHFGNDGSVETTLAVNENDLVGALVDALHAGSIEFANDPDHLKQLRRQLDKKLTTITGTAKAGDAAKPAPTAAMLPSVAPEWTRELITVSGVSTSGSSRLVTARKAEDQALDALRKRLESLPLSNGNTVGAWAQRDSTVRSILDQMLIRAKVTRIDSLPDGSVSARVTFDPRDLWDELRELP